MFMFNDDMYFKGKRFCEIAVMLNFVPQEIADNFLRKQEEEAGSASSNYGRKKIGEYLVEANAITDEQVSTVLGILENNSQV